VPLVSGLVADILGTRYLATLLGISFVVHQVGSSLGASGGGVIFDICGSYDQAWQIGTLIGGAAGVLQILAEAQLGNAIGYPSPRSQPHSCHVRFGSKADMKRSNPDVCFTLYSGHRSASEEGHCLSGLQADASGLGDRDYALSQSTSALAPPRLRSRPRNGRQGPAVRNGWDV